MRNASSMEAGRGNTYSLLVSVETKVAAFDKKVTQIIWNRFTIFSSYTILGLASKRLCKLLQRYLVILVHSWSAHDSQKIERIKMSINGWMDNKNVVHSCNGIISVGKWWFFFVCLLVCLFRMWLLVELTHSSVESHIQEYIASNNWTLLI